MAERCELQGSIVGVSNNDVLRVNFQPFREQHAALGGDAKKRSDLTNFHPTSETSV